MNKKQRLILAIFIPIVILFIALIIAYNLSYTSYQIRGAFYFISYYWEKTWYVWFLTLIFCCIFEYKLFADKKDKEDKR